MRQHRHPGRSGPVGWWAIGVSTRSLDLPAELLTGLRARLLT
jgi:hypothetical protein